MPREIARPETHPNTRVAIEHGSRNGCVFCSARQVQTYATGSCVTILSGGHTGLVGEIVDAGSLARYDRVAIKLDSSTRNGFRICNIVSNLMTIERPIPSIWMLPLSTRDLARVDEIVVRCCDGLVQGQPKALNLEALFLCIDEIWRQRLPIRGRELFPTFEAHGLAASFENEFVDAFDFGLDLLLFSQGRRPISRKRMPPMLARQYIPKRRAET